MQKLLRLRQFIHDTHLFHHDVLAKSREEPSPGARSPVAETPKLWPLHTSILKSAHSQSEESPTSASTLKVQPLLRSPLTPSSPHPSQTFTSSSTSSSAGRKTRKSSCLDDNSSSGRMSRVSRSASTGHAERKTLWSVDDTFLPQAKPPPPLKTIRHARNRSYTSAPAPSEMTSGSSMLYRASSRASLRIPSRLSRSPLRGPDSQVLDVSSKSRHDADFERFESRLVEPTRMSKISDSSSFTGDVVFAPCGNRSSGVNTPPPCHAGLSEAVSEREGDEGNPAGGRWVTCEPIAESNSKAGDRSQVSTRLTRGPSEVVPERERDEGKPVGGRSFTCEPIAENSSKAGDRLQVPTRLNRIRSLRKMRHLFDSGGPKGKASATRGPSSPDVVVSIQCYEHNEWHEEAMADVIPKLRVLKRSSSSRKLT